jgi:HAAS domain-containing protein
MTTATAVPPEVESYLEAVREALDDLPQDERDDLLAEVAPSLAEAADEGGALVARLGPPEEFAAELRAAAGLHETSSHSHSQLSFARRLRRLAGHPAVAAARRLGAELAPIWWAARAYLAVGALAWALDADWSTRYPVVPRIGSGAIGLVLILVSMTVSIWIGLQMRRHGSPFPRLAAVVNVALLLAAIPVAAEVANTSQQDALVALASAPAKLPPGLVYNGAPVENIYPYSRDGRLLLDVLLYDGAGRPIDIGAVGDPQRRLLKTTAGMPILNSYPLRYYELGTQRVAHPEAGPPVRTPRLITPPLRR